MATVTPINGFPRPQLPDSPDIEIAVGSLGDAVDARANPVFATTVARDAAMPSPVAGQECYVTTGSVKYWYDGSGWRMLTPYRQSFKLLSSPSSNPNFQGIPNTLKTLRINWTTRSTHSAAVVGMWIQINGDLGTVYEWEQLNFIDTTIGAGQNSSNIFLIGETAGNTAAPDLFGCGEMVFPAWNSPHPAYLGMVAKSFVNSSPARLNYVGGNMTAAWPYTSVNFITESQFAAGSQFTLEGWD